MKGWRDNKAVWFEFQFISYFLPAEKINKSVMCLVHGTELCIFSYSILILRICCISLICTWAASLCSTKRMGLSLSLSQDTLAFPSTWWGYATPARPLPGLAWLLGLACPDICYHPPTPAVPRSHTYKFSYNYHIRPRSFYTYLTSWAHDALHMYIYELWSLFLFFLPVTRQACWPRSLMLGTIPVEFFLVSPFFFACQSHRKFPCLWPGCVPGHVYIGRSYELHVEWPM